MNELYLGILGLMSVGSLSFVGWLLRQPWCADVRPLHAPAVVAAAPDMTFDHRGLT